MFGPGLARAWALVELGSILDLGSWIPVHTPCLHDSIDYHPSLSHTQINPKSPTTTTLESASLTHKSTPKSQINPKSSTTTLESAIPKSPKLQLSKSEDDVAKEESKGFGVESWIEEEEEEIEEEKEEKEEIEEEEEEEKEEIEEEESKKKKNNLSPVVQTPDGVTVSKKRNDLGLV
ncbi:hypothetical protein LWI29_032853 [Acer saccharum]|uniref:Uncharacterized protein n=1 Tax=Acer saccharum TaxID=4024 RepID=A0AA39VRY9_ACESA|nr:hypothetical protein LWI29_032853 [Acer saccharum]